MPACARQDLAQPVSAHFVDHNITTSTAEHYQRAAGHCEEAAKEYHDAAGAFENGDYQLALEHEKSGQRHTQEAGKQCFLASRWC